MLHASTLHVGDGPLQLEAGQREVLIPTTNLAARSIDLQANLSLGAGVVDLRIGMLSPEDPAQIGQGAVLDVHVGVAGSDGRRNGAKTRNDTPASPSTKISYVLSRQTSDNRTRTINMSREDFTNKGELVV